MKPWIVAVLSLLPLQAFAINARDLVRDADQLYSQLTAKDSERPAVRLRLADLLFDAAIEIDADPKATRRDAELADVYRMKATRLYEEALPSLKGMPAWRVKFQLSRLFAFAARFDKSMPLWRELAKQNDDKILKRESALHLAEQLELSNQPESIREAQRLYSLAYPLAEKESLRSYILYRTSWTQFRLGATTAAVDTLQKSLAMTEGRDREDLLRDLVLFLSREEKPATEQIALLNGYEKKRGSGGLVAQLAEAYYTADRKADYVAVLTQLNRRDPSVDRMIGILDAGHDGMDQKALGRSLAQIRKLKLSGQKFADDASEKRSRERLYRLVLLWDGQRRVKAEEFAGLFTDGVTTMLVVFPESEESKKALGGWLAANPDREQQMKQIDIWLEAAKETKSAKLELALRQNKLELARQLKNWPVVVQESQLLETLAAGQTRPARYQRAKALYELKKYGEALPLFLELAGAGVQDETTVFSQDLALDILGLQKRYDEVIRLTAAWKSSGPRAQEMATVREKARFERAVEGQNAEALAEFTGFCLSGKFTPKSCENARSLAARLKDQDKLVTVLKAQGDEAELARQLEISGRFGESARSLEKQNAAKSDLQILKIAMLFELQGELKERDRVLKGLLSRLRTRKEPLPADEQSLIYLTLQDAGLINESVLNLPLSPEHKLRAASDMYERKPSKATAKALLAHCGPAGLGWEKAQLEQLKQTYNEQRAIKFVGANSKKRFESRVSALKRLGLQADCYMKGAGEEQRMAAAGKVSSAYAEFAAQIRAAEIPDGLDEETLKQVKEQIAAMAEPFEAQAETWKGLAGTANAEAWAFEPAGTAQPTPRPLVFDWKPELEAVRKNPFDRTAQETLKARFEQKGSARLASYINGRLQAMEQQ